MPAKKRNKAKKTAKNGTGVGMKERIAEALELPKEIILNLPKITMLGNSSLVLENYKGIIEYEEGVIRVNTEIGIVKMCGKDLFIREITSEEIMVGGRLHSLEIIE